MCSTACKVAQPRASAVYWRGHLMVSANDKAPREALEPPLVPRRGCRPPAQACAACRASVPSVAVATRRHQDVTSRWRPDRQVGTEVWIPEALQPGGRGGTGWARGRVVGLLPGKRCPHSSGPAVASPVDLIYTLRVLIIDQPVWHKRARHHAHSPYLTGTGLAPK